MLDVSLLKYKDQVKMLGAWFRQRPTAMPISFNEKNMKMFSAEANGGNADHALASAGRQGPA